MMTATDLFFYLASAVAVVSTLAAITRLNAVHALLYLVVSLLAVAVVFFVLGAPFVAALRGHHLRRRDHGAVRVRHHDAQPGARRPPRRNGSGCRPGHGWARRFWPASCSSRWRCCFVTIPSLLPGNRVIDAREVSLALFGPYLLVVELASLLLLAGLVGAYHLGRREPDARPAGEH